MRVVMRIHLGHGLDPLGRHPCSRRITAKILDRLRHRADWASEHSCKNSGAIVLAEGIRSGQLVGATDPEVYRVLFGDEMARLVLTDEPYNVPISGHVTKGNHALPIRRQCRAHYA